MTEFPQFVDRRTGKRLGDNTSPSSTCPEVPAVRPVGARGMLMAGLSDPLGAAFASQIFEIAHAKAKEKFPDLDGWQDARDAFRHFYGASTLARLIGRERAHKILNSVEVTGPSEATDQRMDTWNNDAAMTMGGLDPKYSRTSVEDIFDIALRTGCLRVNI